MEAVDEIARQIRLRDLGGIIVLDLIDMEDRRNRHKVSQALQEALADDKSPTKVLSFNDFGLIIMTRKRVKQSLERTMCAPVRLLRRRRLGQIADDRLLRDTRRSPPPVKTASTTSGTRRCAFIPDVAKALRKLGTRGARRDRSIPRQRRHHLRQIDPPGRSSILRLSNSGAVLMAVRSPAASRRAPASGML